MKPVMRGHVGPESFRHFILPQGSPQPLLAIGIATRSHWGPGHFYERRPSPPGEIWVELVTAGNMRFTQDNRTYLVEPGEVFLPRENTRLRFETGPAGFVCKRAAMIRGTLLAQALRQIHCDTRDHLPLKGAGDFTRVRALLKRAYAVLSDKGPGFQTELAGLALSLLVAMGDAAGGRTQSPLDHVVQYMQRSVGTRLSDVELANTAGCSVPHFHRLFKASYGSAPGDYFLRMKMEHAKQLLSTTALSVKAVAHEMGYRDPAYFSEIFTRKVGMSPVRFRENPADR
jgi:AraC-like DNA-binding protein